MGTRPFPHMLGFSFSISFSLSLSHSSEGNNFHRFCKGNDLAAAISVGVTTVVLRRELLLHRVVGTLLQLAKPVEETYASISRKYATNTKCSSRCVADLIPHSTHKPYISKPIFICFSKRSLPLALTSKQVGSRKITKGGSVTVSMSSTCNNQSESGGAGGLTYKDAGVDIDAGSELVRRIAKMAPGIGGFGGLFPLGDSYLVAGTDGVGTKLKLAFETGIHESIGIDLVAMSVNDIVTSGAKPLFFLDYFATSHLDVDLAEKVIKGIVDGCQQSDCALLGGETAEMPDFYADGEYDLSGFAVGIVKKDSVIDGKNITVGDVLVGLPSSGVHSNGFSLVRRVLAQSGLSLNNQLPGEIVTLGEALMAPTVIYVKQVLDIISKGGVKGIAHVTGGGFTDNIPRVFPKGLGALIYKDSWVIPSVFKWIQQAGRIEDSEMRRTFNMGIGMVLVVSQEAAHRILGDAKGAYTAYRIGEVVSGDGVSYQ
ncbi:phosphoribosylformylglycinamidine cyclo-ligase, chloroplastic/mitochondrial isoform X3 [Camellia sinensis]|uniref:phosphoribosylformylglycinamidine cyclo-ligase, chloroplastic/mitochondrial isoform X3 n=1 Tax=Camellia sinensis TaxID=4442 RepID=UPI00103593FC|nr:phosphoribosylformylglycinamidine cyclo-ligase, chloroplastic/mitochondrial isoform X3 [Camellia sinensis]